MFRFINLFNGTQENLIQSSMREITSPVVLVRL
jgi:hypothetical protein